MTYLIQPDHSRYKSFVLNSKAVRRALGNDTQFHFSRAPQRYGRGWRPFEIEFAALGASGKTLMPDLMVRNGRLFLTEAAYLTVRDLIQPHGELLPVTYSGKDGFLFNILTLDDEVGGIDTKLSTKDEFGEVQSLSFHEERVRCFPLFRTEFDGYVGVFCNHIFKDAVGGAGLNGLVFSPDLGDIFPPDKEAPQPQNH